jgi:uncharacterized repeat protein (TIGR02543 family)
MKRVISLALCFLLVFSLCQPVFAEGNVTWTGNAGDGSWHSADNWNPEQVPGNGDLVTIPDSSDVEYSSGETYVRLDCAGNLTVSGGTLKLGVSTLSGGKLDGAGDIIIYGDHFNWTGGSIEGSGKLIVNSSMQLHAKAAASLDRYLVNNGSLFINGSLKLTGGAEGIGNFPIHDGETLELGGSGSYNLDSLNINNSGTLKIANTCEFVRFNYDFTQQNTGTLEFDIGGPDDFTRLEVADEAVLNGGVLKINILEGYVPEAGDTFEIITYGKKYGTFSSIVSNIDDITFVPDYTTTGLTLTVQGAATAPTAPQNLTATAGYRQVALSWTAPANDGGSDIIRYEVSSDNGANWTDAGLGTSHTFTGLTNGTTYTFKVRAVNGVGNGAEASITATPTGNVTWTGSISEYWNVPGNWNPPVIPAADDKAIIPESKKAVITDNRTVTLDCSGEVEIQSGGNLLLKGDSYLKGGKLSGGGGIRISGSGINGLIWQGGNIEGSGTLILESGSQLAIGQNNPKVLARPVTNNGWIRLNAGELNLTGGITGGLGEIYVSNNAHLIFEKEDYSIGGKFTNNGNVTILDEASVSFDAVHGSGVGYEQSSTGTLTLKAWGAGPDEYCRLVVSGEAKLDGRLEIDFTGDYEPQTGDTFAIMTCGSRTGEFSEIASTKPGISFTAAYTATGLSLTVSDAPPKVWEAANADDLENALNNFKSGDTIKLTGDINYNNGIVIDGKDITFDTDSYTLNVYNDTGSSPGTGLEVKNGGNVYLTGSGSFNISQSGGNGSFGVKAAGGSTATVTNVQAVSENDTAVGVYAGGDNSSIHILGNVEVNAPAGGYGAQTVGQGRITVDGTISAPKYIKIDETEMSKNSGVNDPGKPGYLKYCTEPETGIVWVKAPPATVPSAPRNLTATPGDGKVTLNWDIPEDNGGAPITHYQVSNNDGVTWQTAASSTSYTFTGLTNGTEYTFKVRAVNSEGPGAEASITATPAVAPTAPQDLTATAGYGQVVLSWAAPESDGGSAIIRYEVFIDDGANWEDTELNTSYTFTGLTNGTEYTFKVRAINNVGPGAEASITATPKAEVIWIGEGGDNLWHNADNWDSGQVPVDGDKVIIPNSATVVIAADTAAVILESSGEVTVQSGGHLYLTGLSNLRGKLNGDGDVTITEGTSSAKNYLYWWQGGSMEINGNLIVELNAYLYLTGNVERTLSNPLVIDGGLLVSQGQLKLSGGSQGKGYFIVSNGASLILEEGAYTFGESGGPMYWVENDGNLVICETCTSAYFNAGFEQRSTGVLILDVWGLNSFNKLDLGLAAANFDGELRLNFIDGYIPGPGDTFEIITYGHRLGVFSSITSNIPDIFLKPTYTDTGLILTVSDKAGEVWEVENDTELENALNNFQNGDTIKLTAGFTYNKGIVIDGKDVTFDTGSYTLNVYNDTGSSPGTGLEVKNGGNVFLTGSGQFNIRQTGGSGSFGVKVMGNNSTATVSNVWATVYQNDAVASVYAEGIYASVHVLGNVNVMGTNGYGVQISGEGSVTVDGKIQATNYIRIGNETLNEEAGVEDPEKPDYLKYTYGSWPGVVWVKSASAAVPTAPQNLTATAGDSQVTLRWEAPASDGGSAIIRYEVSIDDGANWEDTELNTSYTFTGLTNGTEYTFKVRAINNVGPGAEASITATPVAAPVSTYTVSFYSNGSLYASKTVTAGTALGANWPDDPVRSGYNFGGWFTGQDGAGTQYTSTTIINNDVNLYAKWTQSGGTPGSGSGSRRSSSSKKSIITDVVETNGDKLLDKALINTGKAVLSLSGSKTSAEISSAVIKRLAEHKEPFAVENAGIRLDFGYRSLDVKQVTGADDGVTVEIGAREVTGSEKRDILENIPPGQNSGLFEIGSRIFDLTAIVKAGNGTERIEEFGRPVAVTVDLSYLGDLTNEEISRLTGVRLEKDEQGSIVPVSLGGQYDPKTKTFTFYTDRFSLYTVMQQRLAIVLTIGGTDIMVDGKQYAMDTAPYINADAGRTLVPVRFVSEALGAEVDWLGETRQVMIKDDGKEIILTIGSTEVLVNGAQQTIDCAPELLPPGRTFVPLRFVGETLGAQVDYVHETRVITIVK